MLVANELLDIFMLPIGFFIQNRLYDLLYYTGMLWVPFMIVAMMIVVEVRMNGLKGEEAVEMILSQLEIRFLSMAVVLMIAVVPYTTGSSSTPADIDYSVTSCNDKYRRIVLGDKVGDFRDNFSFNHEIESYPNLAYGVTNLMSTGMVNAVVATLPCSIGYKDFEYAKANTFVRNGKVANLADNFARQCYAPALRAVLADSSYEFNDGKDAFLEELGALSKVIVDQYAKTDPPRLMTTNIEDWETPPFDNMAASNSITMSCIDALEPIASSILGDDGVQASVTVLAQAQDSGFFDNMIMIGKPDSKYSVKNEDTMQEAVIQEVFHKIIGPADAGYTSGEEGLPGSNVTLWNITELSISKVISVVGAAIAWAIASGTAAIAVDIIPWMISIFQGVVAGLSIIVIFCNCYSGKGVMIVLGTVIALEFSMLGLELAIWIDNVVFEILHARIVSSSETFSASPHAPFLAGFVSLLVYLSLPMFVYKWLSSNIGGGHAQGDLTGSADRVGAIGMAGTAKLMGTMGKGMKGLSGSLKGMKKGGDALRKSLNSSAGIGGGGGGGGGGSASTRYRAGRS